MVQQTKGAQSRIVRDPGVLTGRPHVRGTRIPVAVVLQHLADVPDFDQLLAAFPRLSAQDVSACLRYARDVVDEQERLDSRFRTA